MDTADGFEVIKYIPCASLPYDKPGTTYTVCRLPDDPVSGARTFRGGQRVRE